jgi:hypothetical protein
VEIIKSYRFAPRRYTMLLKLAIVLKSKGVVSENFTRRLNSARKKKQVSCGEMADRLHACWLSVRDLFVSGFRPKISFCAVNSTSRCGGHRSDPDYRLPTGPSCQSTPSQDPTRFHVNALKLMYEFDWSPGVPIGANWDFNLIEFCVIFSKHCRYRPEGRDIGAGVIDPLAALKAVGKFRGE